MAGVLKRRDDGQLSVLVLGYAVIAALLVTVVVDVSHAFVYRRALAAAADGAALAAANATDLDVVYRGGAAGSLPVDRAGARAAVEQYVADADLGSRFREFDVADVVVDGATVSVTFEARMRLPLVNLVTSAWSDGYPVEATATAVVPVR